MKLKTLIILLVICGVLGFTAYLMIGKKPEPKTASKMGHNLLENLPLDEIAKITITSADSQVVLKDQDQKWLVENRFNYPAKFTSINEFVKKLKEMKIGRSFQSSEDTLTRLSLHDPDQKKPEDQTGTRVILADKSNKTLADVLLGREREGSGGAGGHYVMLTGTSEIYLVDQNLTTMDKKPEEWLQKDLLKVRSEDVETLTCLDRQTGNVVYTLKRPEKGKDAEFTGEIPQGKIIAKNKINNVLGALANLMIDDVADPALDDIQTGFDTSRYLKYSLFDGTVYTIYPGKASVSNADQYYFKADVAYTPPVALPEPETNKDAAEIPKTEPTESLADKTVVLDAEVKPAEPSETDQAQAAAEAEKQKKLEEQARLELEAKNLNEKIVSWIYLIPKWKYENLIREVEGLVEEIKSDKNES